MTEARLLEKIKSKGYWRIAIYPATFSKQRVADFGRLESIIRASAVEMGGWEFPLTGNPNEINRDVDWIGLADEWSHHLEAWRFYQSGLFVDLNAMYEEWLNPDESWPIPNRLRGKKLLGINSAVHLLTAIYELAARLAQTEAGSDFMHIEVELNGLENRYLWVDSPQRMPLMRDFMATLDSYPSKKDLSTSELIANAAEIALKEAIEMFKRFDWPANVDALREEQARIGTTGHRRDSR